MLKQSFFQKVRCWIAVNDELTPSTC